ncbi:uncharacterized protein LOC111064792 isoform X1 [Drosophila obscura]|uniref:uncharacterized protein LOC111064792 isoform X1 n=1 Tax=Drosophila obscura TaxID=7282 RepID=UPI001BB12C4F|nr:uncharacterized protein LOC111064792 isoform X1 [Drosophila obscura]
MEGQWSIIDLPLDVLDKVFDLLDHADKLRFAKSDRVIGEAFAYHTRYKYKRMYLSNVCGSWSDTVTICGANIVDLDNSYTLADNQLKIIESHCPNLQVVHLGVKDENCAALKSLIVNLEQLTTVRLWIGGEATPNIYHMLQELPRLKTLRLYRFRKEDASQIYKLVDLEELKIRSNWLHPYRPTLDICQLCFHLQKLRFLKLVKIEICNPGKFPELPSSILEKLHIIDCEITSVLPHIPGLKEFNFFGNYFRVYQLFKWISKHSLALEKLKMMRAHPEPDEFLDMLTCCKKLRYLIIKLPGLRITKDFLASITSILKENGVTPDKPFQLKLNAHKKVKKVRIKHLMAETPNAELLHFW